MSRLAQLQAASFGFLSRRAGVNRATGITLIQRVVQIVGSTGTVLLIVKFLSPQEQGYYYTLWSLLFLQTIFELGFSTVILQLAAHERAKLEFLSNGNVVGDSLALSRLAAVIKKTLNWYAIGSALLVTVLLPSGWWFFSSRGHDAVHWQAPLFSAVLFSALQFQVNPILSFFEGCGDVAWVNTVRLFGIMGGLSLCWYCMIAHHGLYGPAAVLLGQSLVPAAFLFSRRRILFTLLSHPCSPDAVDWKTEVFPFQSRIAVSWLSAYLMSYACTPILFSARGAVEAGQMGLSVNICNAIGGLAFVWISTRAALFGNLVACGNRKELDSVFRRVVIQSTLFLGCSVFCFLLAVQLIRERIPALSHRLLSTSTLSILLATLVANHFRDSLATYLRANKKEPFFVVSLVCGAMFIGGAVMVSRAYGSVGMAIANLLINGVFGLGWAIVIFKREYNSTKGLDIPRCSLTTTI